MKPAFPDCVHRFFFPCFLLLALAATSCGSSTSQRPSAAPAGSLGDFALKDVDGKTHLLSDYLSHKVIVLSFWATWCEPCKKELVKLEQLFSAQRSQDLVVLAISMDEPETRPDVRPYVKQRGFSFPVLFDAESLVTNRFNPRREAPYSLIIDKSEKITWTHAGYVPGDETKLEAAVLQALGSASH